MPLTNTQLRYYDSKVLRLPADKRMQYHAQVDRLIAELSRSVREKTEIRITKVVKAGSFAKFTILRKTNTDPVDVDVVFYIAGRTVGQETLQDLNDIIYDLLFKVYPNKEIEDFELQRRAATVTFVGSGLKVDVVPVIQAEEDSEYGWQFDLTDGSAIQTCAACQIQFVRDRKAVDPDFRTLVRLAKRWRNQAELTALKSFPIELIVAYLLDKEGSDGTIEQRFRRFLLYIAESELKEVIAFPVGQVPLGTFSAPVVILDPHYRPNNVTSRIKEAERKEIVATAEDAWETANFASAEGDVDLWKEVFGPRFKVED